MDLSLGTIVDVLLLLFSAQRSSSSSGLLYPVNINLIKKVTRARVGNEMIDSQRGASSHIQQTRVR